MPNGAYMYSGYNTYAINWSPNQITWLVNGVACLTGTPTSSNFVSAGGNWVFNGHPFYLIFDVCQGGPFAGTGNDLTQPLNMDIAYVSVTTSPPRLLPIGGTPAAGSGHGGELVDHLRRLDRR